MDMKHWHGTAFLHYEAWFEFHKSEKSRSFSLVLHIDSSSSMHMLAGLASQISRRSTDLTRGVKSVGTL